MKQSTKNGIYSKGIFILIGVLVVIATAFRCSTDDSKTGNDQSPKPTEPPPTPDPAVPSEKDAKTMAEEFIFTKAISETDYNEFVTSPHPLGSERQTQIGTYLLDRLEKLGLTTIAQDFSVEVPNPAANSGAGPVATTITKTGRNIVAWNTINPKGNCVVLAGSHYDSKYFEEFRYVGANDSGSSSVLLIHLMHYLLTNAASVPNAACDVMGIWFDGEEAHLKGWNDGLVNHPAKIQDNTYGSRHFVDQLVSCEFDGAKSWCLPEALGNKPVVALVLMDMVGSPDLEISRDSNSSPALLTLMSNGFTELNAHQHMRKRGSAPIEDDHVPFLKKKISAVDMIDFKNLDYWHQPGDELDKISFESIQLSGKVGVYLLLNISLNPKVFFNPTE